MIRCVIIGTAHMHVNEIALYLSECPDTELVAVADVPAEVDEGMDKRYTRAWNLKNVSESFGARVYTDYLEMLDKEKPELAFILSENIKKPRLAEQVAKRGINLIVEKPMATTAEGAGEINALKEKYGVEIYVNWPVAWRPHVNAFLWAVASGKLGQPLKLRYLNGHTGPLGKGAKHRGVSEKAEEMTDTERSRTWWYNKRFGGGAYLDILCYGAFFARHTLGMPKDVFSYGGNLGTPYADCEDNVAALFRYEKGLAVAEGTWTTPRARIPAGPEMMMENGAIWCEGGPDGGAVLRAMDIYGEEVALDIPKDISPYKNIAECYADHVRTGRPMPLCLSTEFNRDVVAMVEAADASSASGRAEKPLS